MFCGNNNAGKTSILEALFFCSNLKSFKSVPNNELINNLSDSFKISVNFIKKNVNYNIFVEKSLKSSKVTLNSKKISKANLLLSYPCYCLVFGFNNILLNESSYRRDFIDSGMFHVEQGSYAAVKKFEKTLKQRNFLLKSQNTGDLAFWDKELIDSNLVLSQYRNEYFSSLNTQFLTILDKLSASGEKIYKDILSLSMDYDVGWPDGDYTLSLSKNLKKDLAVGHTSCGTHRSDFIIKSNNKPVKESASMSTLVLASLVLHLAKINLFHVKHGYKPLLLIDDLFFGIDNKNLNTVIKLLVSSDSNIMLTAPNMYKGVLLELCDKYKDIEVIDMESKI